jgi:hypothetical protein
MAINITGFSGGQITLPELTKFLVRCDTVTLGDEEVGKESGEAKKISTV